MKIRHKKLGVELEVDLPRVFIDKNVDEDAYYKTKGGSYISHADIEWEVVREKWDDVTDKIELQDKIGESCIGHIDGRNVVGTWSTFRLRKIKCVYAKVQDCTGSQITQDTVAGCAFIVERKVP